MNTQTSRETIQSEIQDALHACGSGGLRDCSRNLLNTLGYTSNRRIDLSPNDADTFISTFDPQKQMYAERALLDQWRSVDILFQLTSEEITKATPGRLTFSAGQVDNNIFESYLFLAIHLGGNQYTRTQLASITREVNKLFPMPVMLLFRHGNGLTLAIIDRRPSERDVTRDALKKVTLIKDISCTDPQRAHLDILYDLSLSKLSEEASFHNFTELHRAWGKRLDTSQLNKDFYRDIAHWYFWVLQHPKVRPPQDVKEEERPLFVIRLITRLIFCWFLQEKGLVPRDLFRHHAVGQMLQDFSTDSDTYYKAVLQNLFFATLNQKVEERGFRSYNQSGGRNGNYGVTTLYRYRDAFRNPDAFVERLKTVPFINGGLFDCLDDPFRKAENKPDVRLDGFSERKDNALCLPNEIFFGEEHELDLSDVYQDKRKKKEKVRGIIEILSRYKFTVEENTPLEQEVALDPELLGKVFENLLASYNEDTSTTARKATGSFYTPREIVNYTVDETLIAYLVSQLSANEEQAQLEMKLREVFSASAVDLQNPFSPKQTDALIEAIDRVKILDPACGSGAFPMGALHRLVDLLNKLDPNNRRWKEQQLARARSDRAMAERMQDEVTRENARRDVEDRIVDIERSFDTQFHELDFARKLYLIENCIYGVDIQPIACQIAKLRFFIALIVDQKVDPNAPNFGVRPLPNLETKIVAADALVSLERPVQGVLRNLDIDKKEAELRQVRERHFSARTIQTKEKQRAEDQRLRRELAQLFERDGFSKEATHKLAAWNPYNQNVHAEFFDPEWMFSVTDGFDIVIGNPPYVRIQTLKQQNPEYAKLLKSNYASASKGNFDLYVVFVERGLQLLKKLGNLAYIMPHKFFNAQYGEPLRALLSKGKHLAHIVHFGDQQVFPGVTNYVCLLFLGKAGTESFRFVKVDDLADWLKTTQGTEARIPMQKVTAAEWNFAVGSSAPVFEKLNQFPMKLGQLAERISQGIRTSANEVYVLDILKEDGDLITAYSKQLDCEVVVERKAVAIFLQGREIKPFSIQPSGKVVIMPYRIQEGSATLMPEHELAKRFPKAHSYLLESKCYLSKREEGRFKGQRWYEYGRTQNIDLILLPKILVPDIADHASFALDESGDFAFTSGYGITLKPTAKESFKFILGLANSRVLDFYWRQISTPLRGGFYRYFTQFIEQFPIPSASDLQHSVICRLVDYLLWLHHPLTVTGNPPENPRDSQMSGYFEQLLNGLVYELFFPDELHTQKLFFFRYVEEAKLPVLSEIPEAKRLAVLRETFERIYDLHHPIRGCLFSLGSLETVRIIAGEA